MVLSWNEIKVCAAQFATDWADASYEKGETQTFYNEFFEVFGKRRRDVARYEEHVRKLDNRSGFIDLFWPSVLLVEQKSAGHSLIAAAEQAGTYFDAISERERPRYQLLCDFKTFELLDRDTRAEVRFSLADLPDQVENFAFIVGQRRRALREEDPVNIEASELMGRLHDALDESGYRGDDLERFLVRMVFCMFADDSGIFPRQDMFLHLVEDRTSVDGVDLGLWLTRLFEVLNTPTGQRQRKLDEDTERLFPPKPNLSKPMGDHAHGVTHPRPWSVQLGPEAHCRVVEVFGIAAAEPFRCCFQSPGTLVGPSQRCQGLAQPHELVERASRQPCQEFQHSHQRRRIGLTHVQRAQVVQHSQQNRRWRSRLQERSVERLP